MKPIQGPMMWGTDEEEVFVIVTSMNIARDTPEVFFSGDIGMSRSEAFNALWTVVCEEIEGTSREYRIPFKRLAEIHNVLWSKSMMITGEEMRIRYMNHHRHGRLPRAFSLSIENNAAVLGDSREIDEWVRTLWAPEIPTTPSP